MAGVIAPVAKALYLCEEVDVEGGLTNLYALFDAVAADRFPYVRTFTCYAQLRNGLGDVRVHYDIRRESDDRLIRNTEVHVLRFADRRAQLQVAVTIEDCLFDAPGVYLVELYCDNTWVADTTLRVLEPEP